MNCIICGQQTKSNHAKAKYCALCIKKRKSECDKLYRLKNEKVLSEKKKEWYSSGPARKCPNCLNEFRRHDKRAKYCSRKCFEEEMKHTRIGIGNPCWRGGSAYYDSVHKILYRTIGKAAKCTNQREGNLTFECRENTQVFEWCNISGAYRQNTNDYMELCRSCHRRYDHLVRLRMDVKSLQVAAQERMYETNPTKTP